MCALQFLQLTPSADRSARSETDSEEDDGSHDGESAHSRAHSAALQSENKGHQFLGLTLVHQARSSPAVDGSDGCACDDHAATAADTGADTMLDDDYKHACLQALAQTYSAEMEALGYEPTEDGLYKLTKVTRAGERPIQTIKSLLSPFPRGFTFGAPPLGSDPPIFAQPLRKREARQAPSCSPPRPWSGP